MAALVPMRRSGDKGAMGAGGIFSRVTDAVLPPRCPGCGEVALAEHRFCPGCWSRLRFLGPPACAACDAPFPFDRGEGALCGPCLDAPPALDGIRAAVAYGEVARTLALGLKYGGRLGHAETIARAIERRMPEAVDLLVPVPLHRWRIWTRGYNQAALIAEALARRRGVPVAKGVLRRVRHTPPLRSMRPAERARTVRGAFALAPDAAAVLAGRTVALVDDVYTSGATANACAARLKAAGARKVLLLCWARVLPEASDD